MVKIGNVKRVASLLKAWWNRSWVMPVIAVDDSLWLIGCGNLGLGGFLPPGNGFFGCHTSHMMGLESLGRCEGIELEKWGVAQYIAFRVENQRHPYLLTYPWPRLHEIMKSLKVAAQRGPKEEYFSRWVERTFVSASRVRKDGHMAVIAALERGELKALREWMERHTRSARWVEIDAGAISLLNEEGQRVDVMSMRWNTEFPPGLGMAYPMLNLIDAMIWVLEGKSREFTIAFGKDARFAQPYTLPLTISGEDRIAVVAPRDHRIR